MNVLRHLFILLPLLFGASAASASAGFEQARMADGTEIGIWYPADAPAALRPLELYVQQVASGAPVAGRGLPLVVMSHGTGGSFANHHDTAVALAEAGFVVAALTHKGDNWRDRGRATDLAARPAALGALISYMLEQWRGRAAIDSQRIGAFGFSSGGFTVLVAVGGRPDLARIAGHCRANPRFFDCRLAASHGPAPAAPRWSLDTRIRAAVVAAPALGFTFDRAALARLRVPVQLWAAGDDHVLPAPHYAHAVRAALPRPPDFDVEPGAGHFDFLAPCTPSLTAAAPDICASAPGFDRAAFHARFNAAVVAFFARQLSARSARRRRDSSG